MNSINQALAICADLLLSQSVDSLADDGSITLSGSPDVDITDLSIRINGSGHSFDVEVENLETEVDLSTVDIEVNAGSRLLVDPDEIADLHSALIDAQIEQAEIREALIDARTALAAALGAINKLIGTPAPVEAAPAPIDITDHLTGSMMHFRI